MTGTVVLDASAAVHAVMDSAGQPALLDRIGGAGTVLAPTLLRAEVGNALRKYAQAGVLEVADLPDRHHEAMALVHLFVEEASLFPEALTVAAAADQPVYDTRSALTARRHAAVLLTFDRQLHRLCQREHIACELFAAG